MVMCCQRLAVVSGWLRLRPDWWLSQPYRQPPQPLSQLYPWFARRPDRLFRQLLPWGLLARKLAIPNADNKAKVAGYNLLRNANGFVAQIVTEAVSLVV